MHAHYHTIPKLSRKIGPRQAVVRGLLESLILYEAIETTETKAKLVKTEFDRLVTVAKRGDLQGVRRIHAAVGTQAANKLTQELVIGLSERNSGYTTSMHTGYRRGDAAPLMRVAIKLDADFEAKLKARQDAAKPAQAKTAVPTEKAATKKETAK